MLDKNNRKLYNEDDASGKIITDPKLANGNYEGVKYSVFCGYFIIGPR